MRNLIIVLFSVLLIFSSCGKHVKNIHKTSEIDKTETKKIDSSAYKFVDTSLVITTEKIDTGIVIPAIDINSEFNIGEDDTFVIHEIEEDGVTIKTTYDKKNGKISTNVKKEKEEKRLFIDKTIVEKKGVTIDSNKHSSVEQKNDIVKSTVDKDKKSNYNGGYVAIAIVVIIVVIVLLFWFFGLPKMKKNG